MRTWGGKFWLPAGLTALWLCVFWSLAAGLAAPQAQQFAADMARGQELVNHLKILQETNANKYALEKAALEISQNYEARLLLKKPENQALGQLYHDLWLHPETGMANRLISKAKAKLKAGGYPDYVQNLTIIRNQPKPGTMPSSPMDLDVGVLTESKGEAKALLKDLGGAKGVDSFEKNLQKALDEGFVEMAQELGVKGADSKKAFITGTTAFHPEAYADAAVLQKGVPGKDLIQQTADVSKYKVDEMDKLSRPDPKTGGGPKISKGAAYVESARGTVKDLDKVERVFKHLEETTGHKVAWTSQDKKVIEELKKLSEGIDAAGNIIDPFAINAQIKKITGGKDVFQACKDLIDKMESAWRLVKVPTNVLMARFYKTYLNEADYQKTMKALEEGNLQDLPETARDLQRQLRTASNCHLITLGKLEPKEFLALIQKQFPHVRLHPDDPVVHEILKSLRQFKDDELKLLFGNEGASVVAEVRQKFTPKVKQAMVGRFTKNKCLIWDVDEKNRLLLGDKGATLKADAAIALAMTFYQMSEVMDQGLTPEEENQQISRIWAENLPVVGDFFQATIELGKGAYSGEAEHFGKAALWLAIGAANLVPGYQVVALISGLSMASWDLGAMAWDVGKDKALINAWVESGDWDKEKGLLKGLFNDRNQALSLDKLVPEGTAGYSKGFGGVAIRLSLFSFAERNDRELQDKAKTFKMGIKNLYPDFEVDQALREHPRHGRTLLAAKISESGGNPSRDAAMALFVKLLGEYEKAAERAVKELQAAAEKEYQSKHFVGDALDLDKQLIALGKRLGLPLLRNINDTVKSFTTMLAEVAKSPWVRESLQVRITQMKKKYLEGYLAIEADLKKMTSEMQQLDLTPPHRWNLSGFLDIDAPRISSLLNAYRVDAIGQARQDAQAIHAALAKEPGYQFDPKSYCDMDLFRILAQIRIRLVHTRDMGLLTEQWAGKTSAAQQSRDEALRRAQDAARDESLYLQAKDGIWNTYESAYSWSKGKWEGSEVLTAAGEQIQERLKKIEKEYEKAKKNGRGRLATCLEQELKAVIELSEPQPAAQRPFTATLVVKGGKMPKGAEIRWRAAGGVKLDKAKGLTATFKAQGDGQVSAALVQKGKVLKEFTAPVTLKKDGLAGVIELIPPQPPVNQKFSATLVIKEGQLPKDAQIQWRAAGGVKLEQARGLTATLSARDNGTVIAVLVQKGQAPKEITAPVTVTPPGGGQETASGTQGVSETGTKPDDGKGKATATKDTTGAGKDKPTGQTTATGAPDGGKDKASDTKDAGDRGKDKTTATTTLKDNKTGMVIKIKAPGEVGSTEIFKVSVEAPPGFQQNKKYAWWVNPGWVLNGDASGMTKGPEAIIQPNHWEIVSKKLSEMEIGLGPFGLDGKIRIKVRPESFSAQVPNSWKGEVSNQGIDLRYDWEKMGNGCEGYLKVTRAAWDILPSDTEEVPSWEKAISQRISESKGSKLSLGEFQGVLNGDGTEGLFVKGKIAFRAEGFLSCSAMGGRIDQAITETFDERIKRTNQRKAGLGKELAGIIKSVRLGRESGIVWISATDAATPTGDKTKDKPTETPKALTVKLNAAKTQLLPGESVPVEAIVANADPRDQPLAYTWTGEHEGQGAKVGFSAAKPGKYTLKVDVKSPKGATATASLNFEVGALKAEIVKLYPTGNSIRVGEKATFQVKFTGVPGKSYIYQWQPHPEAAWDKQEGPGPQAAATFRRPETVQVWVKVLEKKGATLIPVTESPSLNLVVEKLQFKLTFTPAAPFIGQEVKARVEVTPSPPDLSLRWLPLPANARMSKESQDGKEITFTLKDDKPAPVKVLALVKEKGDSLGEAAGTIQAQKFKVTATVVGPLGPEPVIWNPAKGGLTPDPKAIAIHQNVRVKAAITPDPPKGPVRWRWSVNPDSHIHSGQGGTEIMANRSQTGSCEIVVEAEDSQGSKLGEAKTSFQVSVDQGVVSREIREAAQKKAAGGKLDDAIALMEQAVKLDPGAANANFLKKLKTDKETIARQLEKTNNLISQGKLADAEKELAAAKNLNAKYPPVLETEKRLVTAKAGRKKEAETKLTQAKTLAGQGRLDEAVKLAEEAAKLDPQNPEALKVAAEWKTLKDKLAKLKEEGKNLESQGKLEGAIAKYQEALKLLADSQLAKHVAELQARLAKEKQERDLAAKLRKEGEALEGQKKVAEAIARYQESLKHLPDAKLAEHIKSLQARLVEDKRKKETAKRLRDEGTVLQQQGKLAEAIGKYQESLKYLPDPNLEAHIRTLQAKLDEEKQKQMAQDKERQEKEKQAAVNKETAKRLRNEGSALQQQGKLAEAIGKYQESLKYLPDPNLEGHIRTLQTKLNQEKQEQQAKSKDQLEKDKQAAANKERAKNLRTEGAALQQQGKLTEAIGKYQESLKYLPDPNLKDHIVKLQAAQQDASKTRATAATEGTGGSNSFSGSFSGKFTSGNVTFTVNGNRMSGAMKGTITWGQSRYPFTGDIQGTVAANGRINGSLTGMTGKVPINGSFRGTAKGSVASGNWQAKALMSDDGNWTAKLDREKQQRQSGDKDRLNKETAKRFREEGAALQQQGNLAGAIGKYQESLKYLPDPNLEAHIRTLQTNQAKTKTEAQGKAGAPTGEMLSYTGTCNYRLVRDSERRHSWTGTINLRVQNNTVSGTMKTVSGPHRFGNCSWSFQGGYDPKTGAFNAPLKGTYEIQRLAEKSGMGGVATTVGNALISGTWVASGTISGRVQGNTVSGRFEATHTRVKGGHADPAGTQGSWQARRK